MGSTMVGPYNSRIIRSVNELSISVHNHGGFHLLCTTSAATSTILKERSL